MRYVSSNVKECGELKLMGVNEEWLTIRCALYLRFAPHVGKKFSRILCGSE